MRIKGGLVTKEHFIPLERGQLLGTISSSQQNEPYSGNRDSCPINNVSASNTLDNPTSDTNQLAALLY